jgi:enterochelin esterase-like enzyme
MEPNVQKVTFESEALERAVLYMIHGYDGNEDLWLPNIRLDKTADAMLSEGLIKPLIIVSPQLDNSYGFNSNLGKYSEYIVHDLIDYVDSHYSTDASREGRYIGGFSMGGWATLHNAFLHPELFSKVGGHSPAVFMDDWSQVGGLKDWLYPSERKRNKKDPVRLAKTQDLTGMSVYLDCGESDGYRFFEGAEALHNTLQDNNVKSEYHLNKGAHDPAYLMSQSREYLLFYAGL